MMVRKVFIVSMWLLSFTTLSSQSSNIGSWMAYLGNQQIGKGFNWWNEAQYRDYRFIGDLQQVLLRTGLGYNLADNNFNVMLGYAYVYTESYLPGKAEKIAFSEHRIFQQLLTRQHLGKVNIQHRYRLEERFFEEDTQFRLRYSLALQYPINQENLKKGCFYLAASNEFFLNLASPHFDRNRLYGGAGYVLSTYVRAEAGVMRQALEKTGRNQIMLTFFNTLPLSDTKG